MMKKFDIYETFGTSDEQVWRNRNLNEAQKRAVYAAVGTALEEKYVSCMMRKHSTITMSLLYRAIQSLHHAALLKIENLDKGFKDQGLS